jgi:hypothetical protein
MNRIMTIVFAGKIADFAAASVFRFSIGRKYGNVLRALLLCFVLLPAAVFAQKVNVDYDREADFTKYKTFAYQVCHRAENPLVDKRIVTELKSRVANEGLSLAETNPDVNVTYHSSTSEEFAIDTTTWGYGFGTGWYWGHDGGGYFGRGGYLGSAGPATTTTTVRRYTRGTLVIDIWDARTNELLWRGTATDIVSDNPEKNEKKLNKAMEKLFKKYPPEKRKK